MATSTDLSWLDDAIRTAIAGAGNDPIKLQQVAKTYGLTPSDIASYTGSSVEGVQQFFRDAGIPLGTMLTGDVQRNIGTEGGIRQLDKGEDVVAEQVVGVQGDKLVVQQYDAYGTPTGTRLTKPNPTELQGWLQALGVVGAAMGAGDILSSLGGSAGAGTAGAANLTVGEAVGTVSNPLSVVTKPVTNGITDFIVYSVNNYNAGLIAAESGIAPTLGNIASTSGELLSLGQKAAIKTTVGAIVNGTVSELLGGDFKEGAIGTVAGTILNTVPIPGTAELFDTKNDVTFNKAINLTVSGLLDPVLQGNVSVKVADQIVNGVSKGASSGLTTLIAGGDSNAILMNTGIGAVLGAFGNTKIPGTKLTGDDAIELITDSFAEGNDASNALADVTGGVTTVTGSKLSDALENFNVVDYITGTDLGGTKGKESVTGGVGNDTVKASAYDKQKDANAEDVNKAYLEILGRAGDAAGVEYWDQTGLGYDDIIAALKGSQEYKDKSKPTTSTTVTGAIGNDTIGEDTISLVGAVGNDTTTSTSTTVTGASDPCENPNQIRDPLTNKCYDPIDYVALGNDSIANSGTLTVTGGQDTLGGDTIGGEVITLGSGNDTITTTSNSCPNPGEVRGEDGICKPRIEITGSREAECHAAHKGYDPQSNSCYDLDWTTLILGGGSGNDTTTTTSNSCPNPGEVRGEDGICKPRVDVISTTCDPDTQFKNAAGQCQCIDPNKVIDGTTGFCIDPFSGSGSGNDTVGTSTCPPGQTRNKAGDCVPSVTVETGRCEPDQFKDDYGNCACIDPNKVIDGTTGLCIDPFIDSGSGNDTVDACPDGYKRNAKGECEVDVIDGGIAGLIKSLTGPTIAGYSPNLTQPFTASRTYKAPPATYDYAGADSVGYEDPYFQRFGPLVYTPPPGYTGAGNPASTVSGGQDTVGGETVNTIPKATGGILSLASGGRTLPARYLGGITDGMADKVPANIDGKRPAALSDGEFVIPADVVSHLGNGNSSAGAKILYEMMDRVRKARTGTTKQGKQISPQRFMPR